MADSKTSDLTALTEANLAGDDLLDIVDTSAVESKSIRIDELDKRYVEDIPGLDVIANSGLAGADKMVVNDAGVDKSISITELDLRWDQSADDSPLTTKGDVATFDSADARIGVGSNDQVLTAASGQTTGLIWAEPDPLTTKGDVMTYDTDAARLGVGTNGDVLTAASGETTGLEWATPAATYTSPLTTKGDVFSDNGSGDARLAVGTNGDVLTAASGETTGLEWTTPAAGFTSPLTTKGDVFTFDSDDQRLAIGTNDQVLTADSGEDTGMKWAAVPSGYVGLGAIDFDPTTALIPHFEDFVGMRTASTTSGTTGWINAASGTGASSIESAVQAGEEHRSGIWAFTSGTSASSFAGANFNVAGNLLGDSTIRIACAVEMGSAPDVTNDYVWVFGLEDTAATTTQNYRVDFTIDRTISTTNYVCRTDDNSSSTETDSGVAIDANWHNFRIDIVDITNVKFYIDGNLVATHTTNIPNTAGRDIGLCYQVRRVAGAAQTTRIDWLYHHFLPGTARGTF